MQSQRSEPGGPVTARPRFQRFGPAGPRTWIPDAGDTSIRHRYGVPWDVTHIPHRWHACWPQTVQFYRDRGVLTGTFHCACGAITDHIGRWVGCNTRRNALDPAGLRCGPATPQLVRARAAAGTAPHPGARRHPRSTLGGST
jgi:hypothetical protein